MTRYTGGCQCGSVRYEVDCTLDHPISCNCSRCGKLGSVLVFAPKDDFRLLSGEGDLTEYRFNTGTIRHLFCKVCGIESFAYGKGRDGAEMAAINVNCLDGVDPRTLSVTFYDGKAR